MDIIILGKFCGNSEKVIETKDYPQIEGKYFFTNRDFTSIEHQMVLFAYRKINNIEKDIKLESCRSTKETIKKPIENVLFSNVPCLSNNYIELFEKGPLVNSHESITIGGMNFEAITYSNNKIIIYSREANVDNKTTTILNVINSLAEKYSIENVYAFLFAHSNKRQWYPSTIEKNK